MLADVIQYLIHAINPISLVIVSFIEAIFFPLPPDAILLPLAVMRPDLAWIYAFMATGASVAGASIGYWLGLRGGRPVLLRFTSESNFSRAEQLLDRYDIWAIAMAGFTPVPYKVFAITAGVFRLHFMRFIVTSLVSRGLRFLLEALLIMFYGEIIVDFIKDNFGWLTLAIFALAVVLYLLWGWWRKRRRQA